VKSFLDKLIEKSHKLDDSDINYEEFKQNPLDDDALRCLYYMNDVESHTICYLRDILVTSAHKDPIITAFLATWSYEEFFHGQVLSKVLDAHDKFAGIKRIGEFRSRLPRSERFRPVLFNLISNFYQGLPAIYMCWGAINEWTTQASYRRLIERTKHPVLTQLLTRIMRQEGKHIDFYYTYAKTLLTQQPKWQKTTRATLKLFWEPVGSSIMGKSEQSFMANYLFSGIEGKEAAERIDKQIQRIPGLESLRLFCGALSKYQEIPA
jgi:hypothetical protein